MLCEKCAPRELAAMRALESLTPSGSEFVNEVERCVAFVREYNASQMRHIIKLTRELNHMRAQLMYERMAQVYIPNTPV